MMIYQEQVQSHLTFLRSLGFEITELVMDQDFTRCCAVGQINGRGELEYKTRSTKMNKGSFGLSTLARIGAEFKTHKTYGEHPSQEILIHIEKQKQLGVVDDSHFEMMAKNAYGFWKHSSETGRSDYLERKKVGAHGIRFRETDKYGRVAVIPMRDINGNLWSYQILNPNGEKRHPSGKQKDGLFHVIGKFKDGDRIGVAESYVTAASIYENTGITCICAFSSNNIKAVVVSIRRKYPNTHITIFADNDRHSKVNTGYLKAQEASNAIGERCDIALPDFSDLPPSKDFSDWNDLFRLKGIGEVKFKYHCL